MRWLFLPPLKPFVLLAAAASLALNIALLMPSPYVLQVFDRVFPSRAVETLAVLSALTLLALAFGYYMDVGIAMLRQFLGGSGVQALFDAPWLPAAGRLPVRRHRGAEHVALGTR